MGTNYYIDPQEPCPHCGRPYDRKHIGKSSAGWCFLLHVYPDEGINTLEDWRTYWRDKIIRDEYGKEVDVTEMIGIITDRRWTRKSWDNLDRYTKQGPNGLMRFRINEAGCIGHGETWDYMTGEFS